MEMYMRDFLHKTIWHKRWHSQNIKIAHLVCDTAIVLKDVVIFETLRYRNFLRDREYVGHPLIG